ncbi:MAG: type I restriction enzyme HsdR N-terminal domain-containing protein, partial [Halobacteriales archaeon]
MDRDELEEYVERAQAIVRDAPQMGEANTKEMLVRPFLEVLGWEFHPSEVKLEYPVRMASTRTKVDYALMLNGTPAVFVETKGLDTEVSEDHREQVTSYMHNEESVEWGLLTNGKRYEFFMYDGTPTGFSLGDFALDKLSKNAEVVGTLSKESVSSGKSRDKAERLRERERAVSTLRNDKDEIADEVTGAVTERVGELVASVAETEAKEFVDRVVEGLENSGMETEEPNGDDRKGPTVEDDTPDILFTEDGNSIASFGGRRNSREGSSHL